MSNSISGPGASSASSMASSASATGGAESIARQPEIERSKGLNSAEVEQGGGGGGGADPMDILKKILSALQEMASSIMNMISSAAGAVTGMGK